MSYKIWVAGEKVTADDLNNNFVNFTSRTKFGGDGSDGALNVASGTTTINLGGAKVVIKQYTTLDIAAGATLAFSNPHASGTTIVIKVLTDANILGTIDARLMGAAGGSGDGNDPNGLLGTELPGGTAGNTTGSPTSAPGAAFTLTSFYAKETYRPLVGFLHVAPGAGGGAGGSGNTTGGTGGRGGGAVLIECDGNLTFSGTINTSGEAGGNSNNATNDSSGGGGGGGAAGMAVVAYRDVLVNTGTITATGGAGGNSGSNNDASTSGSPCEGGGGAGSLYGAGGTEPAGAAGGLGAGGAGARGVRGINAGNTGGSGGGNMGGLVFKNYFL